MRIGHWLPVLMAIGSCVAACDRPKPTSTRAITTTTTRPAGEVPASTRPATTRASSSVLTIGDRAIAFPRARIFVAQVQPHVNLLLFSDDPRQAVEDDYTGNRYFFQIQLDIDDIAQLGSADWHFEAMSTAHADSPNGVFLDGDRKHLQPYKVDLAFSGSAPTIQVALSGQFLLFETRQTNTAPRVVWVQGTFVADLEGLEKQKKNETGPRTSDRP